MTAAPGSEPKPARRPRGERARASTSTANFGSGRREGHDASAFYDRFVAPEVSNDATIAPPTEVDVIYQSDARTMTKVASDSVALVVTSPPYFAGEQYEEDLGATSSRNASGCWSPADGSR